jgi:hypothetical protein
MYVILLSYYYEALAQSLGACLFKSYYYEALAQSLGACLFKSYYYEALAQSLGARPSRVIAMKKWY